MVRLGDYVSIKTGKLDANAASEDGQYPFFTCAITPLRIDTYSYDCECVLVAGNGDLNVKYYLGKFDAYQRTYIIESKNKNNLSLRYLYYFLERYVETLRKESIGGVIKYIKLGNLTEAAIPLPPLEEQRRIATTLDQVSDLIAKRRVQLDKLDLLVKARFVELFGDPLHNTKGWPRLELIKVCKAIFGGGTPSKNHPEYFMGTVPWVSPKDMKQAIISDSIDHITEEAIANSTTNLVPVNSVLMVIRSGILKHTLPVAINSVPVTINQDMKAFVPDNDILTEFLMHYFKAIESDVLSGVRGVTADNIDFKAFQKRMIIVPPFEIQQEFSAFIQRSEKSKSTIQQSLNKLETLKKALMQQYFG